MKGERQIITDKLVQERTGVTMDELFLRLDFAGAKELSSSGILALLNNMDELQPLGEWNRGLLSTSYQWSRGLRKRGEKADGFETGASKTIGTPVEVLYKAMVEPHLRKQWMSESLDITKQTENKSVRASWSDGVTRISVDFYAKGDSKAQIVIQHLKIPDSTKAQALKDFWSERLNVLKQLLET